MGWPQVDSGFVALGIAVISFIAWLSRLEAKTGGNARDIEKQDRAQEIYRREMDDRLHNIEKRHYELDNRVMDKLSNIERLVAKIEGTLSK